MEKSFRVPVVVAVLLSAALVALSYLGANGCRKPEPAPPSATSLTALGTDGATPIPFPPRLRLFTIELPPGDVQGFSIDFPNWSGHSADRKLRSSTWMRDSDGDGRPDYDGLLIRGAGEGVTHVRPNGVDATMLIERWNGPTFIEDLTLHCGKAQGVFAGLEHPGLAVAPNFKICLRRVTVVADAPLQTAALASQASPRGPPDESRDRQIYEAAQASAEAPSWLAEGERSVFELYRTWVGPTDVVARSAVAVATTTKWGLFGYQVDFDVRGCTLNLKYSAEHILYLHGFAKDGLRWSHNVAIASGAEQIKLTDRPWEASWVSTATALITDSAFADWYQEWSWRGGAGIVDQGAGIDLTVRRCRFFNIGASGTILPSSRTRCIMVDDGGDNDGNGVQDFYSAADITIAGQLVRAGTAGRGVANGNVTIEDCFLTAGPGADSLSTMIRVGRNGGGSWYAARSFTFRDSAAYGDRLQIQLRDVVPGKVLITGCNTPALKSVATSLGINTASELKIPLSNRLANLSEGLVQ